MHSITLTGGLADDLGAIYIEQLARDVAKEVHAPVLLHVRGGKHHDGKVFQAEPPPAQPVRLVKLRPGEWMLQARFGKNHDGDAYNAAGGAVTFDSQDAAKAWLESEPAGRWKVVL